MITDNSFHSRQADTDYFRHLLDGAPDAVFVHVRDRLVYVNRAFLKLVGAISKDVVLGCSVLDFIAPEYRSSVQARMEETLTRRNEAPLIEEQYLRVDGHLVDVEVSAVPVEYFGQPGALVFVRDITDRVQTKAALQKQLVALTSPLSGAGEPRFEELFNRDELQAFQDAYSAAAGVASVITTPDGKPLTKPSGFCRLCMELIRGTEQGRLNCFASDARLGRRNDKGPNVGRCFSGGLMDAGVSILVGGHHMANWLIGQVREASFDVENVKAYARDIGADAETCAEAFKAVPIMTRERFEQVAQTLFLIANQLSLRAYQNVQQARFIADRQRAESESERLLKELTLKNQELENIIYVSSHDLRSPLVNIHGFSRRLEKACEEIRLKLSSGDLSSAAVREVSAIIDERVRPSLAFITGSASKMDRLLNGLLRLSRLGRSALHMETLNMGQLVSTVVESLCFQTQQAGASINVSPLPPCRGDAVQVAQVFTNLLDNALKYRRPGAPLLVTITGETREADVLYCVEDTGRGIAPEHHAKVWDVFHRLEPDGGVEGEGLGLSIVQRVLSRMEGKAWLESTLGVGSRFFVALPLPEGTSDTIETYST